MADEIRKDGESVPGLWEPPHRITIEEGHEWWEHLVREMMIRDVLQLSGEDYAPGDHFPWAGVS